MSVDVSPVSSANPSSTSASFEVARRASAKITIHTRDGDTVTISAGLSDTVEVSTYGAGGATRATASARSFSVTVDGHLDRGELRDIRRAVHFLQKLARDFQSDHPKQAARDAGKLEHLGTIAGIEGSIEVQASASFEAVA